MNTSGQNLPESGGKSQDKDNISFVRSTWGSMQNAIIGCSAAVLFGLAVLLMSILSVTNPQSVFPQDSATVSAQKTEVQPQVMYYLPYPGVLPDSPLYKLKVARDWVRLWLTFDEVQKAQRELLYADKRINAAKALIEGGKPELGVSTATKAEKYLEKAVDSTLTLQQSGKDVKSLLLTLAKATTKHGEVLQQLIPRTSGTDSQSLEGALTLTLSLQEKVAQGIRE